MFFFIFVQNWIKLMIFLIFGKNPDYSYFMAKLVDFLSVIGDFLEPEFIILHFLTNFDDFSDFFFKIDDSFKILF